MLLELVHGVSDRLVELVHGEGLVHGADLAGELLEVDIAVGVGVEVGLEVLGLLLSEAELLESVDELAGVEAGHVLSGHGLRVAATSE